MAADLRVAQRPELLCSWLRARPLVVCVCVCMGICVCENILSVRVCMCEKRASCVYM